MQKTGTFYLNKYANPNGRFFAIFFILIESVAAFHTANAGVIGCTDGIDSTATIQCSSLASTTYSDKDDISITCPCSDLVSGLAGTVKYKCQNATWQETSRTCQCTTCTSTSTHSGTVNIQGGTRSVYIISKKCQTGCVCDGSCKGSFTQYICECSSGYSVKNQGTSTCSCEENVKEGVCYVQYCNAGYYSTGASCIKCPNAQEAIWQVQTEISGTSPSKNTGDIHSCYIPRSIEHKDKSGYFQYTENCPY